jgi:hypothetical protein
MSPVAAEGIDLPPLLSALVGATPAELAERIVRLHADGGARRNAAGAGLALIESAYSEAGVTAALRAAIGARWDVASTVPDTRKAAPGG